MRGRFVTFTLVSLFGLVAAASAFAQSEPRRPSISQRLQRFRQDVFGQTEDVDKPKPKPKLTPEQTKNQPNVAGAGRKVMGAQRPVMVAPPGPQPTMADSEMEVPPPIESGSPAGLPGRMQVQSARRAQTGAGPVTIITPGSGASGSIRQPVEEARRRAMGEPTETLEESETGEFIEAVPVEPTEEVLETVEPMDAPVEDVGVEAVETEPAPAEEAAEETTEPTSVPAAEPNFVPNSSKFSNNLRPVAEPVVVEPVADAPVAAEPVATEPAAVEVPSDNVLFTSKSPVLSVVASGPRTVMIGKEAEFLVKVKNTGAPANNVMIKVVVPSYADVASCRGSVGSAQPPVQTEINSGLEWTIDRLDEGAEETLTIKLVPRKSSPLDLSISHTFTPETSQTMVEVQEAKLAMSLTGPSEVLFGQTKVYKLTVSNPGNGDTHNVSVTLPPIGHGSEAPGTHKLGDLAAGESKTIDIELTARQSGAIDIKAQSFAEGGLRAEASQEVRVRRAELKVAVEAPQVKYAGTPSTYTLVVENMGDALADGVTLSAILPADAKFLSASGGRLDPQQARVNWNVGSLPAGGQRTFELQCALHAPGENRFQIAVQATGDLSASTICNTHVEAIADLKLEVRDPQGPVAVGDEAVYEVRILNRGTKAAQGIDLALFFSDGLEPTAADGGTHEIGEGQVVFQPLPSLGPGETAVYHVRSKAAQAGNHVFRAEVLCESLSTKLAAEEATHFYGDQRVERMAKREPTLAKPPIEKQPVEKQPADAPPTNPYE